MRMRFVFLLLGVATAVPLGLGGQAPAATSRDAIAARIAELQRIHTPEGIDALESLEVNGSRQWISIRGLNRANPVLLVLHGGPGSPMMAMSWAYQKPWEDFFTVVNWDQRGVGKSFSAADSARLAPTLTNEQLAEDAAVVVQHLRARLGERKIVLLGWSYGTVFGPLLIQKHPEWFAAWVPLGQSSGESNERELYTSLVARVQARGDTEAMRELRAMDPYPPSDRKPSLAELLGVRRWVHQFDGGWYGKKNLQLSSNLNEWGAAYTAEDLASLGAGASWSGRQLFDVRAGQRPSMVERFEVPVVMLHGRFDLMTPYSGARKYFDRLRAPKKEFITFERSAHFVMLEEPGRFLMALVNHVLPLAGGSPGFSERAGSPDDERDHAH